MCSWNPALDFTKEPFLTNTFRYACKDTYDKGCIFLESVTRVISRDKCRAEQNDLWGLINQMSYEGRIWNLGCVTYNAIFGQSKFDRTFACGQRKKNITQIFNRENTN